MPQVVRCRASGNPVGTDTRALGGLCDCSACAAYRRGRQDVEPLLEDARSRLALERLRAEETERRLRAWVSDLQAGCWINCVYCGHRYGPDPGTPVAMADVLRRHVEVCPEHPLSAALARVAELEGELASRRAPEDE